jgi:hypothetical protein
MTSSLLSSCWYFHKAVCRSVFIGFYRALETTYIHLSQVLCARFEAWEFGRVFCLRIVGDWGEQMTSGVELL